MTIDDWRRKVDEVDEQILKLLCERAKLVQAIGSLKNAHNLARYDPSREQAILQRLLSLNRGPLPPQALKAIYREIFSACRALQEPLRVVYLGPPLSFTHRACTEHFGSSADAYDAPTIPDVFMEVEKGNANYGVVPIENTAEGGVNDTLDMLIHSSLKVCAETFLEIHHCLLSRHELPEIKVVYSRETALAQCKNWLRNHLPQASLRSVSSTSEGARLAAQEEFTAAVADREAADHYGLKVIAENIEDVPGNKTRFLVVGKEMPTPSGQDKTSILFSVPHKPGTLYRALTPLQQFGINLTMIASRPARHTPWEYVFFIDFQGHITDEPVRQAVEQMKKECLFLKVLGSYPEAQ